MCLDLWWWCCVVCPHGNDNPFADLLVLLARLAVTTSYKSIGKDHPRGRRGLAISKSAMSDRIRRTKSRISARDKWDHEKAEEHAHEVCKPLACKFQSCLSRFLYSPQSVKDKRCGPMFRAWEECFAREVKASKDTAVDANRTK